MLALAVIAWAHGGTPGHGVFLPDLPGVADDPRIRDLASVPSLFLESLSPGGEGSGRGTMPVTWTTYALNHAWSGRDPWSWHLVNVLLHAIACLGVYALVRTLVGSGGTIPLPGIGEREGNAIGAGAALLLAAHPHLVPPLGSMAARPSLLLAALGIPATALHLRAVATGRVAPAVGAGLLLALAMFSHPAGLVILGGVVLAELLVPGAPGPPGGPLRSRRGAATIRLLPLLGVSLLHPAVRPGGDAASPPPPIATDGERSREGAGGAPPGGSAPSLPPDPGASQDPGADPGRAALLFQALRLGWFHAGAFLAAGGPRDLDPSWGRSPSLDDPPVVHALAGALLIALVSVAMVRRAPAVTFLGITTLLHAVTIPPVRDPLDLSLLHQAYAFVTWLTILASLGIMVLVRTTFDRPVTIHRAVVLTFLVPLAWEARQAARIGTDPISWWSAVVELGPGSARAHAELGVAIKERARLGRGGATPAHSTAGSPPVARGADATSPRDRTELARAAASLREALRIDPTLGVAWIQLGLTLELAGDFDGALAAHDDAVRLSAGGGEARFWRGLFREGRGDLAGAEVDLRGALAADPRSRSARSALARVLVRAGRDREARALLEASAEAGR